MKRLKRMGFQVAGALVAGAVLLACLSPGGSWAMEPEEPAAGDPPAPAPAPEGEAGAAPAWARWLDEVKQEALALGIGAPTLALAFDGLTLNDEVVALDRRQPEVRASYRAYLEQRLTQEKVARGRSALEAVEPLLARIEADFGVPGRVIAGIWGMESQFGRDTGRFDVVRSLASLAYDGRREALFRRELLAALTMLDQGYVSREAFMGSWAGAVGQSQFLPSSVLTYGVDQDGDGRVDLWNSTADALASIANYLKAHGWDSRDGAWGIGVVVPSSLDRAQIAAAQLPERCVPALRIHSRLLPVRQWKALGLYNRSARDWPADDQLAALVEPDGPDGPAYLVTRNYHALLSYNCSNFYALSVALLADSLS